VQIASQPILLGLLLAGVMTLQAQEVKYVDLTAIQQRTELRHPPAPPVSCNASGGCVGGGIGGGSVGDGAPDIRNPQALRIDVLRVYPVEIDPRIPFEAEFRVLNTGKVSIELPISPHLSDLQPDDASLDFNYFSLALVMMPSAEPYAEVRSFGFVELYGSSDHAGTMINLQPGQSIRVKANIKLRTWPSKPVPVRLYGALWLRDNTFHSQPGGGFIAKKNLYPNITPSDPATLPRITFIHSPEQQDVRP
jgi:hypothetical protein